MSEHTWGDVYRRHRRKGMDPSDAAFRADEWERRRECKKKAEHLGHPEITYGPDEAQRKATDLLTYRAEKAEAENERLEARVAELSGNLRNAVSMLTGYVPLTGTNEFLFDNEDDAKHFEAMQQALDGE